MEKKDNSVTVSKPSTLETPAISSPDIQYMQTNEGGSQKNPVPCFEPVKFL
jgi:hypothetical protein